MNDSTRVVAKAVVSLTISVASAALALWAAYVLLRVDPVFTWREIAAAYVLLETVQSAAREARPEVSHDS